MTVSHKASSDGEITVLADDAALPGNLLVPKKAKGLVVFAHGSGGSRLGPRNRAVAAFLNEGGFATLLFDLLTAQEKGPDDNDARLRFDIALLTRRLIGAFDWLQSVPVAAALPLGVFGASTGAAAALCAAAARPQMVSAVVSRGGRPDLAGDALPQVRAPTLLIAGGNDPTVIDLNRAAGAQITCEWHLETVAGASHRFEEPGALEQVAMLTRLCFARHLRRR